MMEFHVIEESSKIRVKKGEEQKFFEFHKKYIS